MRSIGRKVLDALGMEAGEAVYTGPIYAGLAPNRAGQTWERALILSS